MITKVEPMPNIQIDGAHVKPTASSSKKFLRTCSKCQTNCYSSGEYSAHMKEKHGKDMPKDNLDSRSVDTSLTKKEFDVPEEILVKPRKADKPKDTVANSRKGRQPAKESVGESTPPKTLPNADGKPKRTRRTNKQIDADKAKGK